jgi:hypothetical protein
MEKPKGLFVSCAFVNFERLDMLQVTGGRAMKKILLSSVFVFAALCFATTARAENPSQSDPNTAAYLASGQPQSISANSARWYKFDYAGDKSQITILMPNGANTLVAFNVFTPEQAQSWWEKTTKPIGRGTAYQIDCETGQENYLGQCQSNDLKWVGEFNFPGTFFVQVVNYNTGTANFTLTIAGTGVYVAPSVPTVPPVAQPPKPLLPTTGGIPPQGFFAPPREIFKRWWIEE